MNHILENGMSRRQFIAVAAATGITSMLALSGCDSTNNSDSTTNSNTEVAMPDAITMVWLPNESASGFDAGREEFGKILSDAAGIPVNLLTTTDYNVAIEAIASGKAHLANMGAEGYIEAQKKNSGVTSIVTTSDEKGTLDGALYYSRICVSDTNLSTYKSGSDYSLDNIKGKSMSFVSTSSTSGFKVPATQIVKHFNLDSTDELTQAGFFSQVLFGSSHPGSCVNLLMGNTEVAAFDDVDIATYLDLTKTKGTDNTAGTIYTAKSDAAAPFDRVAGKSFGVVMAMAVQNGPIAANTAVLPQPLIDKIVAKLTSSSVSSDPLLFGTKGDNSGAVWSRDDSAGFIAVDDSWYDPIRQLDA